MLHNLAQFFSDNAMATIFSAILSYLLGSINVAIIVTRAYIKKDIRTLGSGNAGMTNVFRSVGKVPGIITLIGDISKSVIAILASRFIYRAYGGTDMFIEAGMSSPILIASYISGFFCLLGHLYPVYYGFKGGKGVLVTVGTLLCVDWRVLCILLGIFIIVFIITRIVSISTLTAIIFLPLLTFLFGYFHPFNSYGMPSIYILLCTVLSAFFTIIVYIMHKDNIKRLIKGEEKKLTLK